MSDDSQLVQAWDRIDGVPDPAENMLCIGHEATLDLLAARYAEGRMHHAWLLTGPLGIGKATLAARFAGHVFRHTDPSSAPGRYLAPAPGDPVEGKVTRGAHPNLLHMRRPWNDKDKKWRQDLTIDEIRRTVSFFGTSAGTGGWRVAIVDTADDLNANASNALLKVLEEPPPRTLFLVLAHTPRGQIATIRSRCVKLPVRPLAAARVIEALERLGFADEADRTEIELAAELAAGSVRRAILLLRDDGIELYRRFRALAQRADALDWSSVHELAGELSPAAAQDRYRLFLEIVHDFVARRIRNEPEPLDPAAAPAGISGLARWVEVWEKTRRSAELAEAWNLDRKQVVLNLFAAMKQAA